MWLTLAAAALLAAEPDSAEAQFKKMEQQVLKCKTLQTELEVTAGSEKESFIEMKGRMLVAPGNKIRMELEGELRKEKDKMVMVSDGKKMIMDSTKRPGQGKEQDTPKHMTEASLASYSRSGIVVALFMSRTSSGDEKPEAFDIDKEMAISDFKLGKKEGGTQAIEYKLATRGGKEPLAITVWVDTKTNLPVKRVAMAMEGKMTITMTEKYAKTELDGKIDDKEFTLPK
jgi:outer membrane lipoprotein-sorting protein